LLVEDVEVGAGAASNVVNAVCAAVIFPADSADSTLLRNVPIGSVPLVLLELSCSISVRSFSASVRLPFLMSASRLDSVVLKASVLAVDDELVVVVLELVRESPKYSRLSSR